MTEGWIPAFAGMTEMECRDCRAPKAVLAMTEEDERCKGMMGLPRRYTPRNDRRRTEQSN